MPRPPADCTTLPATNTSEARSPRTMPSPAAATTVLFDTTSGPLPPPETDVMAIPAPPADSTTLPVTRTLEIWARIPSPPDERTVTFCTTTLLLYDTPTPMPADTTVKLSMTMFLDSLTPMPPSTTVPGMPRIVRVAEPFRVVRTPNPA